MFIAHIYVTLHPTVNDPQGLAIKGALHSLGFDAVESVRAGKYLQIKLSTNVRQEAEERTEEMCKQLLANPVIERFQFDLKEVTDDQQPG